MKLLPINIPKVKATAVGLMFDEQLSADEWAALWPQFELVADRIQWLIGDWLVYGQKNNYGEKYQKQIAVTGYKYKSLANMASVCRSVQFSLRRENLTFWHHALVASFDPKTQKQWLDLAEANQWESTELAEEIRRVAGKPERVKQSSGLFIPTKWVSLGVDWFRRQFANQPVTQWPQDRREILKRELEPVVEIYNQL